VQSRTEVVCSTLDDEWKSLGSPPVSVVKIDVEGAEPLVLQGATECLRTHRPAILLEWNEANLRAHGIASDALLRWAHDHNYFLCAAETGAPLMTVEALRWQMAFSENFVLLPAPPGAAQPQQ
jgi:hypothetical protein